MLWQVLRCLAAKRSTAGGITGGTYAYIRQAAVATSVTASAEAHETTLDSVTVIPTVDALHATLLSDPIGLQEPDEGVCPIRHMHGEVTTVWHHVATLFFLEACFGVGAALKSLQRGVGVSEGVEAAGHVLRTCTVRRTVPALAADDRANALLLDVMNAKVPQLLTRTHVRWANSVAADTSTSPPPVSPRARLIARPSRHDPACVRAIRWGCCCSLSPCRCL